MLLSNLLVKLPISFKEKKDLLAIIANNLEENQYNLFFNSLLNSINIKEKLVKYIINQPENIRIYCENHILKYNISISSQKYLFLVFEYLCQTSSNNDLKKCLKNKMKNLEFDSSIKDKILKEYQKGKINKLESIILNKSAIKSNNNILCDIKNTCFNFLSFSNSQGEYGIIELRKNTIIPKNIHIFINGFTNDNKDKGFDKWLKYNLFSRKYNNLYGFHWASGQDFEGHIENFKNIKIPKNLIHFAKINPSTIPILLVQIIAEWKTAKNNSEKYSLELFNFIKIMKATHPETKINLYGHSLGANLIYHTLNKLLDSNVKINNVYLFGGASINSKYAWNNTLSQSTCNNIYNFYSKNDDVLSYLYKVVEIGDKPIGLSPINNLHNLYNFDVSDIVSGHSLYIEHLPYFFKMIIEK